MRNYTLPPKLNGIRRKLQRSLLYPTQAALLALGVMSFAAGTKVWAWISVAITWGIALVGLIYQKRRVKRQSIAMGFVCPRCGESLFGHYDRFAEAGNCPTCNEFVADELAQKLS